MHAFQMSAVLFAVSLGGVACTSRNGRPLAMGPGQGSAGTSGAAGASATGSGASGTGGVIAGAAGTSGTAGATAGTAGVAGGGAAGSTTGAAGTGIDGGTGGGPRDASLGEHGDGPVTTAGCANHNYQLCIDFENGIDTNVWSGGTPNAIVTDQFAHGGHSYHLYSSMAGVAKGGRLLSKTVGTIKNQVWARFYIHFSPGAPGNHGNIVAAYDKSGTWYEIGYQFDGMMGVWHGGGGEHPRRSLPYIIDQWYCVEAYFDGAAAAMPRWWIDGTEAMYYEPMEAGGGTVVEAGPTPSMSTQFTRMEAGFSPYAGLELKQPNNVGDQTDTRVLSDLWIDDVAFDTQRIGCIE